MFQTKKNNTMARSLPITILIIFIAILTGCASSATQAQNQSLSHLPAEIRAREAQRTNLSKHNAQAQAQRSAMIVPNTGMRPGMSQRAIDAYAARLTEAVNNQPGMSQRAVDAYSLRLTGLAGLQAAMSNRALAAYSDRLAAEASWYQNR